MAKDLSNIVLNAVRSLYYHIDPQEWEVQFQSHPDFPTVRAVTDTLEHFDIEHIAAEVPKDVLEELPNQFFALLKNLDNQELAWITQKKQSIHIISESQEATLSREAFVEQWQGIIIAVETNPNNTTSILNTQNSINILLTATILIGAAIFPINAYALPQIGYIISALIGLSLSILIILELLGIQSKLASKICNLNKQTDCESVLQSSGAKIMGDISLSDLSLIFFATITLTSLTIGYQLSIYWAIALMTIPVIVYSLFYQSFIIKKWCPLCLGIVGVLILQLFLVFQTPFSYAIQIGAILKFAFIGAGISTLWLFVKPLLKQQSALRKTSMDLLKFKKDPQLFNLLLNDSQSIAIDSGIGLIFGPPNATNELTVISNPFCGYCQPAFFEYQRLLSKFSGRLKINFRFNVVADNEEDKSFLIAVWVQHIYNTEGPQQAWAALTEWFEHKDYPVWKNKWEKSFNQEDSDAIISHKNWCNENELYYTPASIFNGKLFPKLYDLKDAIFLFEDILPPPDEISSTKEHQMMAAY